MVTGRCDGGLKTLGIYESKKNILTRVFRFGGIDFPNFVTPAQAGVPFVS